MENNIEEDIKILEEFIDGLKLYNPKTGKDIKPTQFGEGQRYVYSNVYYAIEHILRDYKRVLKENEELRKFILEGITIENSPYQNYQLNFLRKNFIPIKKIQDMIKELEEQDRKWTEELEEPYSNLKNVDRNLKRIKNQVDILEELLKEDKLYGR